MSAASDDVSFIGYATSDVETSIDSADSALEGTGLDVKYRGPIRSCPAVLSISFEGMSLIVVPA
jgi:hypothetical protein